MDKVPFTFSGLEKIKLELDNLKKIERPQVIQSISTAREHGDLKENAEYHAAKEKQAFIEGRITELEDVTSRAEVIDLTKLSGETVTFGTKVSIVDEENEQETNYQNVGPYEANLEEGLISVASPMAKALIGKKDIIFNLFSNLSFEFEIRKISNAFPLRVPNFFNTR